MILDKLNLQAEAIHDLFGVPKDRADFIYETAKQQTHELISADLIGQVGYFDKNKYIHNALLLTETESEQCYILYHMGGFMQCLEDWIDNNENIERI